MLRCFARFACVLFLLAHCAEAARVADSLVRIQATSQEPNYRAPWSGGEVASGVGAGFIVAGNRIMTNAHVVSNGRFLAVSKEGDPKPYPARVVHVAHDCDLALLTVDNPQFFKNTIYRPTASLIRTALPIFEAVGRFWSVSPLKIISSMRASTSSGSLKPSQEKNL